jgi:L-lactate dehydrogenase complex protein LldF
MSVPRTVEQAAAAAHFIADRPREEFFDTLMWALREARDHRASEVPEWEQFRDLASAIKEHTLSHLADYLEQFEASAKRNGAQVHWAHDAYEHNQIVADILSRHGAKNLIKSKSMLTEECDTRRYLENRGVTVTETDLGERIQQLDDEPPAHIVGPAWQKSPQDIAQVFAKAYGSDPNNSDPVYLAHEMRVHTRALIEKSDAGMTGANFAVAETGAIVTVTNEGNADLSGNVPKLRICSVGSRRSFPQTATSPSLSAFSPAAPPECPSRSTLRISSGRARAARCTSSSSTTAARSVSAWRSSGIRSSASAAEPA